MWEKRQSEISQGVAWEKREQGIYLTGYSGEDEELILPDEIEGEPVRWAAPYAFARTRAVQIELPPRMEKIGNYSFYRCFGLRSLSFSDALTDVGSGAFNGCGLRGIRIDHYRGEKSSLKFLVDELRYALYVTLVYHRENGTEEEARLLFPEHYEEAVENTPARIVETHYHGSGGDYRQCVYHKEIDYEEYDSLFVRAKAREDIRTLIRIALARLREPYRLTGQAEEEYADFLRGCAGETAGFLLEADDMKTVRFLLDQKIWKGEALETALTVAEKKGHAEMSALLLQAGRKRSGKKTFDL